jgi:hypothetical protein
MQELRTLSTKAQNDTIAAPAEEQSLYIAESLKLRIQPRLIEAF